MSESAQRRKQPRNVADRSARATTKTFDLQPFLESVVFAGAGAGGDRLPAADLAQCQKWLTRCSEGGSLEVACDRRFRDWFLQHRGLACIAGSDADSWLLLPPWTMALPVVAWDGASERMLDLQPPLIQALEAWERVLQIQHYRMVFEQVYGVRPSILRFSGAADFSRIVGSWVGTLDNRFVRVRPREGAAPLLSAETLQQAERASTLTVLDSLIDLDDYVFEGMSLVHLSQLAHAQIENEFRYEIDRQGKRHVEVLIPALRRYLEALFHTNRFEFCLSVVSDVEVRLFESSVLPEDSEEWQGHRSLRRREFDISELQSLLGETSVMIVDSPGVSPSPRQRSVVRAADGKYKWGLVASLVDEGQLVGLFEILFCERLEANTKTLQAFLRMMISCAEVLYFNITRESQKIDSVIRKNCTAIHPALEWRFAAAARSFVQKIDSYRMDRIEFHQVYALMGITDICRSSDSRAEVLQADLLAQLNEASAILRYVKRIRVVPYTNHILFQIARWVEDINNELRTAYEADVSDFINQLVDPALKLFKGCDPAVDSMLAAYWQKCNHTTGTYYENRARFETSVARINETMLLYLQHEQKGAQDIIPHYFERHSTDGVDHLIYAGASLLEDGDGFSFEHVKNLRLWQLLVICGCAYRCANLNQSLSYPLDVTHLVIAQDLPITISFDYDEKQIHVEGVNNIRLEIIKKRVEKALVADTDERLVQPGRLVVVFSTDSEAREYRGYIEYLQSEGYLCEDLEELKVSDLQGLQGLNAFRVTIDLSKAEYSFAAVSEGRAEFEWL